MVAEFKAVVEPHLQDVDARIDFSWLVELLLVDEAYDGNLLVAERSQQLRGQRCDIGSGQVVGHSSRQIVNRDRDLAIDLYGLCAQRY